MVDTMYHVGDIVVIVSDLVKGDGRYMHEGTKETIHVNDDMVRLAGRDAEITGVSGEKYIYYELDISPWAWTADMFEESYTDDVKLDFDLLGGCGS